MKIARFGMMLALFSGLALAETFTGTLTDVMCKTKDPATHTKDCALGCKKAGFGLVTADGKFLKFDETGNTKAVAALEATSKQADLKATVDGKVEGSVIRVDSVKID